MSLGFVSEEEIESKRRLRQEEWEKVRKADDPKECPEEPYDGRSLYDRLKEQKDKKEAEVAEQFALRNMVRGLEDDEVHFLDDVQRRREEVEKTRELEETVAIAELKRHILEGSSLTVSEGPGEKSTKPPPPPSTQQTTTSKPSQRKLISGLIKRKRCSMEKDDVSPMKRDGEVKQAKHDEGGARVVGHLPGIVSYGGVGDDDDTSDSNSSGSDDDLPGNQVGQCRKVGTVIQTLQAAYDPKVTRL